MIADFNSNDDFSVLDDGLTLGELTLEQDYIFLGSTIVATLEGIDRRG